MAKRAITLFLAASLAAMMVLSASCAINPDAGATTAAAATTTAAQTAAQTTAQAAKAEETTAAAAATTTAAATKADAAPADAAIYEKYPLIKDPNINEPGTFPLVKETVKLTLGLPQSLDVTSYAYEDNFLTKYMQDKTNIELVLELFPDVDADQKIEIMINSNAKLPDILFNVGVGNDMMRYRNGEAGALISLNEYYEQLAVEIRNACKASPNLKYEDLLKYIVSPDGNVYGLAIWYNLYPQLATERGWFNMNFLKAVGMGIPQKQDEFVEVLRAFRDKDPNGNGQNDEIPMVGCVGGWNSDVIQWVMQQYIYVCNRYDRYTLIENGKLDVAYDKEEWREGLRFVKSLVDEGLLSTLSFTQDNSSYRSLVAADEQIVGLGISGSISGFAQNIKDHEGADAIEGPGGVRYAVYTPDLPGVLMGITKYCEKPVEAFLWACSLYNDPIYQVVFQYGEPDVDWVYTTDPNAKGMYEDLGVPAYFRQINQVWGNPSNSNWQGSPLCYVGNLKIVNGMESDGNENNNELKNAKAVTRLSKYWPDLEKVFFKNIYLPDEIEQTAEARTNLRLYVDEASVLFVTGAKDIEKEWDGYLQELEKLQYKQILAVDQTAYTRTQKGVN